jgi:hypothetical protein
MVSRTAVNFSNSSVGISNQTKHIFSVK